MHFRKSIAFLVSESKPYDSQKLLKSQKENQNFINNFENSELNTEKAMSDHLRTNILLIGYQFTLNEFTVNGKTVINRTSILKVTGL